MVSLIVALLLGVASVASATSSFYWYGEGNSTCWQAGQLGSPSTGCDSVGAGYLPTPGGGREGGLERMVNISNGGIGVDVGLTPTQDYCSYYRLGDNLTSQISANEGSQTGLTTPEPFSSYQEGDAHQNVCQAYGSHWGLETRDTASGNECHVTCGMHHYVSFRGQNSENYRPWGSVFGEPSLIVSAESDPQVFTPNAEGTGGWGYVCPEVEETATKTILEYCLQEWRGQHNGSEWENERVGECKSWGEHNIDTVITIFWPGTQFETERSGSANTYVWTGAGGHHFEATITKGNLVNAINADQSACANSRHETLSTTPANWVLVGVEQGHEAWGGITELGEGTANLQLHTEYTPIPPEVTTSAASEVQLTQAKLNGTVNPRGTDTHYYFQYGKTTEYGSSTSSSDAGSGMSSVPEGATLAGLEPGTTYHYRLVASSAGGEIKGNDQTLTTPGGTGPSVATNSSTGYQAIYYVNGNKEISYWDYFPKTGWSNGTLGGHAAPGTSPSDVVINLSEGYQAIYYVNSSGEISYWDYIPKTGWSNGTLGGHAAPGTSPSAVANLSTGYQAIYYVNSSGEISYWDYFPKTGWSNGTLGGHVAAYSSPSDVVMNPSEGYQAIYYQESSGEISYWDYFPKLGWSKGTP